VSEPLVSVAMATCNGEPYVRPQLDSILEQSWPNIEVVVTDDCSTDGTWETLSEYAKRRGVKIHRNEARVGISANFERAIRACSGEFIALADQDDVWKQEKIATLVSEIGSAALIYSRVEEVLGSHGELSLAPIAKRINRFARRHGSGRPLRFLLAENWIVSHSLMFSRNLVDVAVPFPASYPQHDWWLGIVAASLQGVKFLDQSLQLYRRHERSATYRSDEEFAEERRKRRAGGLRGLRRRWREQCGLELRRLSESRARLRLEPQELRFLETLERHYRCGVESGWRVRSALAAVRSFRLFARRGGLLGLARGMGKCLAAGR
jgi:glycosyltransferase involved in cell wall biosynthesis